MAVVCNIRKWRMEDASAYARALNNKKIQEHLRDGLPFPYTVEDGREYIASALAADGSTAFAFAITVEEEVVGSIGVFRKGNGDCPTAEMGYFIAEPFWGKGIGSSAVKQTCAYIFGSTDIVRIVAKPFARNAASCRILEKAGFVCEGTRKNHTVKNGVVIDAKRYALTKERSGTMIRRKDEATVEKRVIGGGVGEITLRHKFTAEEMFGKCRLCAELVIMPGQAIGEHAHTKDMEFFYLVSGQLVSIGEDGRETPFRPGDMMLTADGAKHALRNDGAEPAVLLAVIVNEVP